MILSIFFQCFGVASFIEMIVMFFLVRKELKKQLPTELEKAEILERKFASEEELKDKKLARSITADFRVLKKFENLKNTGNTEKN